MAKVPKTDARMARFVLEDLRRRSIPVDGLLKQVGLRKNDLDNSEPRLPLASVLWLIARAASLVGDPSYSLRLGASRDPSERGLLGFLCPQFADVDGCHDQHTALLQGRARR